MKQEPMNLTVCPGEEVTAVKKRKDMLSLRPLIPISF